MIFAFDHPKGYFKGDTWRPTEHGDKFNGLDDLPEDQYAWYGPAPPHLNELLDEFDIDRYLDNKISQQSRMTGTIQSALRSLDDYKNSVPHVIFENKKQGENNDET